MQPSYALRTSKWALVVRIHPSFGLIYLLNEKSYGPVQKFVALGDLIWMAGLASMQRQLSSDDPE